MSKVPCCASHCPLLFVFSSSSVQSVYDYVTFHHVCTLFGNVTDLEVQHELFKCCIAGLSVQMNFTIIVQ